VTPAKLRMGTPDICRRDCRALIGVRPDGDDVTRSQPEGLNGDLPRAIDKQGMRMIRR